MNNRDSEFFTSGFEAGVKAGNEARCAPPKAVIDALTERIKAREDIIAVRDAELREVRSRLAELETSQNERCEVCQWTGEKLNTANAELQRKIEAQSKVLNMSSNPDRVGKTPLCIIAELEAEIERLKSLLKRDQLGYLGYLNTPEGAKELVNIEVDGLSIKSAGGILIKARAEIERLKAELSKHSVYGPHHWKTIKTTEYVPWTEYPVNVPSPLQAPADSVSCSPSSSAGAQGDGWKAPTL